jgi:hypothetical protein
MENLKSKFWPRSSNEEFETWYNDRTFPTCELDKIGFQYNCDKCNSQRVSKSMMNTSEDIDVITPGHNYTKIYEKYFSEFRDKKIHILEIGVGNYPTNGYSLRMWLEYFPLAEITMVDWSNNNFKFDFDYDESRVNFYRFDQSNVEEIRNFANKYLDTFDIIIDDCSHIAEHQFHTLKCLFDTTLKQDGLYFIEDIHDENFLNYLPMIYDSLNSGNFHYNRKYESENINNISSITLYRSIIVIKKGSKLTR